MVSETQRLADDLAFWLWLVKRPTTGTLIEGPFLDWHATPAGREELR